MKSAIRKFASLKLIVDGQAVIGELRCIVFQIKRSDSAFFWEEREIMANANSEWIVQVTCRICTSINLIISCHSVIVVNIFSRDIHYVVCVYILLLHLTEI